MTVVARITCETLPGLRDFRTASDKSCGGGLGTRLPFPRSSLNPSLAGPDPHGREGLVKLQRLLLTMILA